MHNLKNILFISAFGDIEDPQNNDRLNNVIRYAQGTFNSTVITSNFSHKYKRKRHATDAKSSLNVVQVSTLFYGKNTGIKRLLSHFLLGIWAIPVLVREIKKNEIVYIISPPFTLPFLATFMGKVFGRMVILDFTDLWPQAFSLVSSNKGLKFLLSGVELLQKWMISVSDICVVINNKYVEVLSGGNRSKFHVIPIGIAKVKDPLKFDANFSKLNVEQLFIQIVKLKQDHTIFVFGGNLGTAYDFDLMIHLVNGFQDLHGKSVFIFAGDGSEREILERKLNETARFEFLITGRLDHHHFIEVLSLCNFGLNIYKSTDFISTSYKMYDYMMADVWLVNNLSGDSYQMIEDYKIGVNIQQKEITEILRELKSLQKMDDIERMRRFSEVKSELDQENLKNHWLKIVQHV